MLAVTRHRRRPPVEVLSDSRNFAPWHTISVGVVKRPVTTEEFLRTLNDEAARLGVRPITERMVRDWVDEGLIEPRSAKGQKRAVHPIWHFSKRDAALGAQIVRLKRRGIRRVAELRLHLWSSNDDFPIDQVADALSLVFSRLMRRKRRTSHFKYDHRYQKRLPGDQISRHAGQLGPQDAQLAQAGFEIAPSASIEMASELVWGKSGSEKLPARMLQEIAQKLGTPTDAISTQFDVSNLSGLFGAADEIEHSGEQELRDARDADLPEARKKLHSLLAVLSQFDTLENLGFAEVALQYERVREAMGTTEWLVSFLAAFALQTLRKRTGKQ